MSNNPFNNAQTFMGIPSVDADDLFGEIKRVGSRTKGEWKVLE